jgi:hypothetical protein
VAAVVRNKRIPICISLIICLVMGLNGSAQTAINLQKTITIPVNAIQLDSLLNLITKQAGVKFSVNTRKFPAGKYIRITTHKQTIAGIMQEIKQRTGVYYAVLGDHIILLDNPPPANKKTTNAANATHTVQAPRLPVRSALPRKQPVPLKKHTTGQAQPPVAGNANKKVPSKADTAVVLPVPLKTTTDSGYHKSAGSDSAKTIPAMPAKKGPLKGGFTINQSTPPTTSKEKSAFANNLLLKGGLSADDVFYCNPTIQLGIPYVYGIAAWSTNFNLSGFRYGLGGAVPLSDRWKLHLQLTTGNLSSAFDTTGRRWEFRTRLHRAACIAEANLSSRVSIQFGPVFNLMKLTFYRAGEKVAPGLPTDQVDKKFNLLQPIYTISDNYSMNRAQSTKTWIGFQVGIFYDLNFFKSE